MKLFPLNLKRISAFIIVFSLIAGIFVFCEVSAEGMSCVYVSPDGNDAAAGTKSSPLATLSAAFSKLDDGGTVVITGALSKDVTLLDSSVTKKCTNTKPILITGRDPENGTIYKDATLPYNSSRLYGEMKLEYLKIAPIRNHAFFNTYGNRLIFGNGISYENFGLFIHGGAFNNMVAESSYFEINSGSVSTAYMGGAFVTSDAYGVSGDSVFVINGGSLANLCIGFDTSSVNHTFGKIDGNVIIRHNGGIINNIYSKLLKDNTVGGYIAIISKGGLSTDLSSMPAAKKGVYRITYTGSGDIAHTSTPGLFTLTPEDGYHAYINGKKVTEKEVLLPEGESVVKFLKDTVHTEYEGVLVDADGQLFMPENIATRQVVATAAVRCLENEDVSYNYKTLCAKLSDNKALPFGWENSSGNEAATKAECVYILCTLFDAHSDSTKLFDFSDVPDSHRYAKEIRLAAGKGKLKGCAGDQFFPDKNITRLELCEMLTFYFDRVTGPNVTSNYEDVTEEMSAAICAANTSRTAGCWDFTERKYILPDSGKTEDYIKALHSQSTYLSPDEIRSASDVIAKKVRENILSTPNTASIYDFDSLGITTVYYVSEKNGNDLFDGLSENTPFKTPAALVGKLRGKQNVAVLFERGGTYRTGNLNPLDLSGTRNIVLGSYGNGQKPLVIQSRKNFAQDVWTEVLPNVYRLQTPLRNVGVMAFDHDVTDYTDGTYDELFGEIENIATQGFDGIEELDTDLQFYCELQPTHTEAETEETVNGERITTKVVTDSYDRFTEGYLYLYSAHGNPSERFSSIEIGENYDLVDGSCRGCIIDNISFKFTGSHGIGFGTSENLTVSNCIFSWLGGSILWETEKVTTIVTNHTTGETKTTITEEPSTCYGNAVEIYGGCNGYYVYDNWIYQIFDDGITNQFHGETDCIQKDIVYSGNLLEYVYHMFSNSKSNSSYFEDSDFPTEGEGTPPSFTADLELSYNICRMAGYGWGGPMKNRVHTGMMYRTYVADYNKDERVFYNLFDSNGGFTVFSASNANDTYDSNIYIQSVGTKLRSKLKSGILGFDENAHRNIANLFGDKHAVTILTDADQISDCRKVTDKLGFLGAQIRSDTTHALRFLFTISHESYAKMAPNELPASMSDVREGFGGVIIPEDFFDKEDLRKNTLSFYKGTPVRAGVVPAVKIYSKNNDEIVFTLCLTDILPKNFKRKYVVIPYMTYEDEGSLKTVYGEQSKGISIFDIAEYAYVDPRNSPEIRESIYKNILTVADPQKYPAK